MKFFQLNVTSIFNSFSISHIFFIKLPLWNNQSVSSLNPPNAGSETFANFWVEFQNFRFARKTSPEKVFFLPEFSLKRNQSNLEKIRHLHVEEQSGNLKCFTSLLAFISIRKKL